MVRGSWLYGSPLNKIKVKDKDLTPTPVLECFGLAIDKSDSFFPAIRMSFEKWIFLEGKWF
jgi:hypothetical protein